MDEVKREALWQEFLGVARDSFGKMFGQDGQNGLVTFREREERACELGDDVATGFLRRHLREESTAAHVACCPHCGKPACPRGEEPERREVIAKPGTVDFDRLARYCPSCRRVFFPSGRQTGSAGRGVQPRAPGEARMVGRPGGLL